MHISVSDAEKHGTSIASAYIDFRVATTLDDRPQQQHNTPQTPPRPLEPDFLVRRRYRDFVWLRDQLCLGYPAAIVPPLPPVDSPLKDDRFSARFIAQRRAGLELFLRRVARHGALSRSKELRTFLEAKVWELTTVKNASTSTSSISLRQAHVMICEPNPKKASHQ